jgi:hypothetical protein
MTFDKFFVLLARWLAAMRCLGRFYPSRLCRSSADVAGIVLGIVTVDAEARGGLGPYRLFTDSRNH